MKEIFAAFSAEIFRPLITLLIPGFWALSPALASFLFSNGRAWRFVESHVTASSLCFLVVSVALGMILENLGGEIENSFFRLYPAGALDDWYRYLALALSPEPIAFDYIRSYVQRLKYEAGMCAASPFALLGSFGLPISWQTKAIWIAVIVWLGRYFLLQVKSSVQELVHVRRQLIHYLSPMVTHLAYPISPILKASPLKSFTAWKKFLLRLVHALFL